MPTNDIAVYELVEDTKFVTTYERTSLDVCTSVAYTYEDIISHHIGSMGDVVSMYDVNKDNIPEVLVRNSTQRIRLVRLKSWIAHIIASTRDGAKITGEHAGVTSCVHSDVEKYLLSMGVKHDSITDTFSKYKPRAKADKSDTELLARFRRYVPTVVAELLKAKFGTEITFIHSKTIDKIANVAKLAQANGFTVDQVTVELEHQLTWYMDSVDLQVRTDTVNKFKEWYTKSVA